MATPPSDDTITLFKLLADGQWHNYYDVKDALAATVPPGRALRKYDERYRSGRGGRNLATESGSPLSEDEQILYGARACAQSTISSWKGKALMFRGEAKDKEIRVKPGFQGAWGIKQPAAEAAEPGKEAGGYTEVPPTDSEPSEPRTAGVDEALRKLAENASAEPAPSSVKLGDGSDYAWPPLSPAVVAERVGCGLCGLQIADQKSHAQWHVEQRQAQETLLSTVEASMRFASHFEKALHAILDQFQGNMQGYLDQQFTQLNAQFFALRHSNGPTSRWAQRESPPHSQ